jgi:hypothetical protein
MGKILKTAYAASEIEALFDAVGEDCNTINFRVLWQDSIVTRDHHVMRQVLATSFAEFEKGPVVKLKYAFLPIPFPSGTYTNSIRLFDIFGDGIFNADGVQWKLHRAMTKPFFG